MGRQRSPADHKRSRKQLLYRNQAGLCVYCRRKMLLVFGEEARNEQDNPLLATFEHLDDRLSSTRRHRTDGARRVALACYECNHRRGNQRLIEWQNSSEQCDTDNATGS